MCSKEKFKAAFNTEVFHVQSGISPQNSGRMVNRAKKSLPNCAEEQVHVLAKLVINVSPKKQLWIHMIKHLRGERHITRRWRKEKSDALTDEVKAVKGFYIRHDVSRLLPGKKDYIS